MNETARSKAEERFAKAQEREKAFQSERAKAETALDNKITRLRALRLAKEATDREDAARRAIEKAASGSEAKPRSPRRRSASTKS